MKFKLFIPAAAAVLIAGNAAAQDDGGRMAELERQLQQTLQMLQAMNAEMDALKSERSSTTELDERLSEMEDIVYDVESRVGSRAVVNAFDAQKLDIGGFLHMTATHVEGEDGGATSFNRQVFELLAKAQLAPDWSVFVAQAFIRESGINFTDAQARREPDFSIGTATDTVIAWANYKYDDSFNVQAGRFITPHGIINIEHFPALLLDPEQPQFLRPFSGQTIFPNFTDGIQIHGKGFFGESGDQVVGYNLYTGNFDGNADRLNVGGRLEYSPSALGLTFGVNATQGVREDNSDTEFTVVGGDIKYDKGSIIWKNEVWHSSEETGDDRFAFYTQPGYRIDDQWTVFYRYDFLDNGSSTGQTIENVGGISFKPVQNVHLRTTFTHRHFDEGTATSDANAEIVQVSGTFSF